MSYTLGGKLDMFGGLINSLRSKIVLSNKNITDLKWYISSKYADLSSKDAAKIFADAVNSIIDKHIPGSNENIRSKIKTILFENAIKKAEFEITKADVFKVCLLTRTNENIFYDEFLNWIHEITDFNITNQDFYHFIKKVHSITEEYPYKNIEDIIASIDKKVSSYNEPLQKKKSHQEPLYDHKLLDNFYGKKIDKAPEDVNIRPVSDYEDHNENNVNNDIYNNQDNSHIHNPNNIKKYNLDQNYYNDVSKITNDAYSDEYNSKRSYSNVKFTHVNSNEYKPIYSFQNELNHLEQDSIKDKFTTFIKKVTMKKFLSISIATSTALLIAGTAISDSKSNVTAAKVSHTGDSLTNLNNNQQAQFFKISVNNTSNSNVELPVGETLTNIIPISTVAPTTVTPTSVAPTTTPLKDSSYKQNSNKTINMKATAYDLSVESCGKNSSHPEYGITASGTRATAKRTIAVDPSVIPLGSKLYIVFPDKYSYLNGEYIAEDTGRLIKGNIVDIFLGEDKPGQNTIAKQTDAFGVQKVTVYVLNSKVDLSKLGA
jgi:3D (Asp-Asp-Asp) domain-containing protein